MQSQFGKQLEKYEKVTEVITQFIYDSVKNANANGVILGLSGGIDSAVTAYLCKRAIGNHCLALLMPNHSFTPTSETEDGLLVAETLKMKYKVFPINYLANMFTVGDRTDDFIDAKNMKLTIGNLNARIRANMLYYEGQKRNYLVVGTDDKSEHLIGYFTKYGDGACDILPIVDLYKSEVRELAGYLDVPEHIIRKKSSPHLWANHQAGQELGVDYDTIDIILKALYEKGLDVDEASKETMIPRKTVLKIKTLHDRTEHKRQLPPFPKVNLI